MARKYRYHPPTVGTTTWTITCGKKNHTIHLVRGQLVLSHHTKAEINTAILRHHLGESIRPCLALLVAMKQRSATLKPPMIPDTMQEALCLARFARRTTDRPASVRTGFSAATLTAFFHPVSHLLHHAGLDRLTHSAEFSVPSLHLTGFTYPRSSPDLVIPELRRALYAEAKLTELLTAIETWITRHNSR